MGVYMNVGIDTTLAFRGRLGQGLSLLLADLVVRIPYAQILSSAALYQRGFILNTWDHIANGSLYLDSDPEAIINIHLRLSAWMPGHIQPMQVQGTGYGRKILHYSTHLSKHRQVHRPKCIFEP